MSESVLHKFRPRIAPRDFLDLMIALLVGCFQMLILFGLPAAVIGVATDSFFGVFIGFCGSYVFFSLFIVTSVSIDSRGMSFKRMFGSPRFLGWSSVHSITRPSRREVIIQGWLWPLFPSREMSPCMSSLGHVRIDWSGGYCYFPPQEIDRFLDAINAYKKTE